MRFSVLALALLIASPALAAPMQLSHQGHLADSLGAPLEGAHALTVSIFAAGAGGSALWSDEVSANLEGGYFSVVLGSDPSNPMPADLFDGSVRYAAIAIDGGPEVGARLPITSVPNAIHAGHAAVAASVSGGVVDASEIRIGGATVIGSDGAISAPVGWSTVTDRPAGLDDGDDDTLGALACASGEIAVFNGLDWGCGAASPDQVDASAISGTISVDNLPVGSGDSQVAAGDHTHSFSAITGRAAFSQLPTGTAADTVATGNHGHNLADLSGDLPLSRTTGDLPLSRTTGNLDAARLTGSVALANLPVGSSSSSIARGDHTHGFSAITGTAAVSQLPTGTTGSTVALGNHGHDLSTLSGTASLSQLPVGTTSSTVARGDHGHAFSAITGSAAIGQLPVGTTSSTVARGDHDHDADYVLKAGDTMTGALKTTAVTVGTDSSVCNSSNVGKIIFASGNFQGCDGTKWRRLEMNDPRPVLIESASAWTVSGVRNIGGTWPQLGGEGSVCPTDYHVCTYLEALSHKYSGKPIQVAGGQYLRTMGNYTNTSIIGTTNPHNSLLGYYDGGGWGGTSTVCGNNQGPMLYFYADSDLDRAIEWDGGCYTDDSRKWACCMNRNDHR